MANNTVLRYGPSGTDVQAQLDSITTVMSTDTERLAAVAALTTAYAAADTSLDAALTAIISGKAAQSALDSEVASRFPVPSTATCSFRQPRRLFFPCL